ncbi:4-phosphoerythronate dehydrogenase [bacterium]|nr:4-phosphoerythronate dehydrogenase [bacterium]
MRVVVDENIPYAEPIFSQFGEVKTVAGRAVTAEMVSGADALIVRSVTRVGEALLAGSKVRFVGTSTIGTDHVDTAWLERQGIGFSAAPGSNAESVAQYIAAALVHAAGRRGTPLSNCSIGIVGVGNCGSRVERIARALGMEVLLNDPPLMRASGDDTRYRPLRELLDCNFLTLHVPLTREGKDPTWKLIDEKTLNWLLPEAVVINASRGFVVDEQALIQRVLEERLAGAILDAWENEPAINIEHMRRTMIATPHIAGYSFDGKVAGALMIAEAVARHFEMNYEKPELPMPPAAVPTIELKTKGREADSILAELISTAYPITRDDSDLRAAMGRAEQGIGPAFDQRRKLYPLRREFNATRVILHGADEELKARVRTIGFEVE